MTLQESQTISLIGMPGCGKSSVGVLLAKRLGWNFLDTDLAIQVRELTTLQDILEGRGYLALREIEEQVILAMSIQQSVVSTGGSLVYSQQGMSRLSSAGPIVYLQADMATLEERIAGQPPRGIASAPGQSFAALFAERTPLYERYASIVVDAAQGGPDIVLEAILSRLGI